MGKNHHHVDYLRRDVRSVLDGRLLSYVGEDRLGGDTRETRRKLAEREFHPTDRAWPYAIEWVREAPD